MNKVLHTIKEVLESKTKNEELALPGIKIYWEVIVDGNSVMLLEDMANKKTQSARLSRN